MKKSEPKPKAVLVRLPVGEHRALKIRAAEEGRSMEEIAREALSRLSKPTKQAA